MTFPRLGPMALLLAIVAGLCMALAGPAFYESKNLRDALRASHDQPSPATKARLEAVKTEAQREKRGIVSVCLLLALASSCALWRQVRLAGGFEAAFWGPGAKTQSDSAV